jgi:hypothetical protein
VLRGGTHIDELNLAAFNQLRDLLWGVIGAHNTVIATRNGCHCLLLAAPK